MLCLYSACVNLHSLVLLEGECADSFQTSKTLADLQRHLMGHTRLRLSIAAEDLIGKSVSGYCLLPHGLLNEYRMHVSHHVLWRRDKKRPVLSRKLLIDMKVSFLVSMKLIVWLLFYSMRSWCFSWFSSDEVSPAWSMPATIFVPNWTLIVPRRRNTKSSEHFATSWSETASCDSVIYEWLLLKEGIFSPLFCHHSGHMHSGYFLSLLSQSLLLWSSMCQVSCCSIVLILCQLEMEPLAYFL